MTTTIDISKMSKAEVLMRLYNGGFNDVNHGPLAVLQRIEEPMTLEEAQALIDASDPKYLYFDYVGAKALKVDLTGDTLDPRLYDRDCGRGAAARALGATGVEW
jgi:hypothetical protein